MDFNIVGLVGPLACGKGVVADYLIKKYKYTSFSLSTLVHEEAKKRGHTIITRTLLQDIGNDMRAKEGDGVLARRAIEKLKAEGLRLKAQSSKPQRYVIEGIRNPGEVAYLRTIPGFFLIAVDAAQKIRYQRVLTRAKPWDPTDWETFVKVDGRDKGETNIANGQQVGQCIELADVKIENNGKIVQIQKKIKELGIKIHEVGIA